MRFRRGSRRGRGERRRWSDIHRLGRILRVGTRHLAAAWWESRRPFGRPRGAPLGGPERLRLALEEIGGTFIKLGQMLALQPDILPLAYCDALFKLLDRVEPFPYAEVERTVREELGRAPEEVFDRLERRPLATASIGQVHVAEIGGRRWAVKVQRPSVETDFAGDIRLMTALLAAIRALRLRPLAWLVEPLSEFVAWTREELDYRIEARYMERLRRHAMDNPHERVPEVLHELSTRRLLVTELLEGTPILDHLRALAAGDQVTARRLAAGGFEPRTFARHIIENFLGDAFRHGIFHADLHPANLMILPGNVVGYLDFGITGVLGVHSRRHLVALTRAYTRGDLDAMCAAFFEVSSFDPTSRPRRFREGLDRLAASWYERRGEVRHLRKNFTLVMLDMLRLSRATGVWPERDVIKYIRSAIAIDGLISRFAPGFELGRYLDEVCSRHLEVEHLEAAMSRPRFLAMLTAGASLLRDGGTRGAAALDRLLVEGFPGRDNARDAAPRRAAGLDALALRQSLFVVGAALVAAMPSHPPTLGFNTFTAAAALSLAGLLALVDTARRLARSDRRADKETVHA